MVNQDEKKIKISFTREDFLLIATAIIWGSNPTIIKLGFRDISPFAYNTSRLIVAAISCWIFLWIKERDFKIDRQDLLPILAIGFIGNFINQYFLIIGLNHTTAGNASLIVAMLPIIVTLINVALGLEKIKNLALIGTIISFIGITLIILGTGQEISFTGGHFFGNLMILLRMIAWAIYTILNKKYLEKYSSLKLTTYGVTIGMLPMLILWYKPLVMVNWASLPLKSYMSIFYSGVFSITLGTIFWNIGVKKVGSTKTAFYSNIAPVVSVILGMILLSETIGLFQILGAILIFTGLALSKIDKDFFIKKKEVSE